MKQRLFEVLFDEGGEKDNAKIRILEPKWEGVVYHYGAVELPESEDNPTLSFEYDVDFCPDTIDIENYTEEDQHDFETVIGDILVMLIEKGLQDDRENNTDQSSEQREL